MANINTLVANVNNGCLFSENSTKLHFHDHTDVLNTRRNEKKYLNRESSCVLGARVSAIGQSWRLRAVVQENSSRNGTSEHNVILSTEIPVTCYQILGVHDQAEKDEIVKSAIHLTNAEVEEGYSEDAVISRQRVLLDVRDKLLFEPEYAGNFKDNQLPKASLRIPWAWLPGALCLLQEVGEDKLVLEIGRRALQHPESKPYVHDLLLSMALAECAIAKVGFEKNNIAQGFEALARAQCLLRSKISLGKMMLLSQIEESLEELAPACTLDLLGMPRTPENAERRLGAISALRELLRQGLDVEASCRVQDWSCFLNQALSKLMATEIVELVAWDDLALTRKNRKSLESQTQRVVIDFKCFYVVFLAHIALGFSSKQTDLINKAKTVCECLTTSEGIDLKFEEAFCSFLLGQGDEATAVERLRQLESNSNPSSQKSLPMKETRETSTADKPLETWLKETVLGLFPDTRDCSSSLADFFVGERRASRNRSNIRASPAISNISQRPIATLPLDQREEMVSSTTSSRHLGSAVKPLAPPNLQSPLLEAKVIPGSNVGSPPIQLKRTLGAKHSEVWKTCLGFSHVLGKVIYAMALGCVFACFFKLVNFQVWRRGNGSRWRMDSGSINARPYTLSAGSSTDFNYRPMNLKNSIARNLKKVLSLLQMQRTSDYQESVDLQTASLSSGRSTSMTLAQRQPMSTKEAESLVKRWQEIKAEALGPTHDIDGLFEILEGSMLVQWQALADAAKERSCFWRFVLLKLTVVNADTLKDGMGREMAEIEVVLEEAAELVDESQPKNPTYYSPYKIRYLLKRQDDGSWRFCESDIVTPS